MSHVGCCAQARGGINDVYDVDKYPWLPLAIYLRIDKRSSLRDIATEVGVSHELVRQVLDQHDVQKPPPLPSTAKECPECKGPKKETAKRCWGCFVAQISANKDQIEYLWNTGMTTAKIGEELGITSQSVRRVAKKMRAEGRNVPSRLKS